jgi:hypothetical protein
MKILLGNFSANVGREYIFKQTIWNENLQEFNEQGVRVVNLPLPKVMMSKVRCSHIVEFINSLGRLLIERRTTKLTIF